MTGHTRGRLRRLIDRVKRHTIWDDHAIPATEGYSQRILKRRILPLYDVVFIVAGWRALGGGGLPSIGLLYSEALGHVAAAAIGVGALLALVGVSFPRLWAMETIGKILLGAALLLYSFSAFVSSAQGSTGRDFVGVAFLAFVILPGWRLSQLGEEWRARRAAREAAKRKQAGA